MGQSHVERERVVSSLFILIDNFLQQYQIMKPLNSLAVNTNSAVDLQQNRVKMGLYLISRSESSKHVHLSMAMNNY